MITTPEMKFAKEISIIDSSPLYDAARARALFDLRFKKHHAALRPENKDWAKKAAAWKQVCAEFNAAYKTKFSVNAIKSACNSLLAAYEGGLRDAKHLGRPALKSLPPNWKYYHDNLPAKVKEEVRRGIKYEDILSGRRKYVSKKSKSCK